ncbi:MAG: peptidylprolyl isomerase [Oscillospiraceae bacterium]|nr:peptidylprolyl isomerase [Oscillospiraceae bacterium]
MTCKNCGKELEADEIICTQCDYDNTPEAEETGKTKINPWKIAFPATVSFGLLLVLCWLLFYGVTGYWIPRANDIHIKDSYTVNADALQTSHDNVVATVGKNKLTNGQLMVFYSRLCNENKGSYAASEPLDQQIYDKKTGLTWQQYLLQLSLNTWKQYRVLTDMALDADFKLPADYQQSLDSMEADLATAAEQNGYASVEALLSNDICEGCTLADYRNFVELSYYANLYFEEMAANIEVEPDEINAYFVENEETLKQYGITKDGSMLVDFRSIFVKVEKDLDENVTVDQWNDCKDKAQGILDQWLSNPSEENFASLAVEKSDDKTTGSNGGLQHYILKDYLTKVDVRHILIMPEGGTKSEDGKTTVYSEAEWEECRKKAQEIYNEYLNGERTEELFSDLAKMHSKDGNAADGGIYTDVEKDTMVEEFDAWIFDESRQPGDTGLVKTQYGYHIMYFVHRDGELNDWLFDAQRKYGDYGILKADDGYYVVYFVRGDEAWSRVCEDSLKEVKADVMLAQLNDQHEINVRYGRIRLYK